MFRDHMLKAKRLTDFRLPYVVLVSKFIEYFGIDVEDELEESTGLLNHTSNQICTKWTLSIWEMDGQLLML